MMVDYDVMTSVHGSRLKKHVENQAIQNNQPLKINIDEEPYIVQHMIKYLESNR